MPSSQFAVRKIAQETQSAFPLKWRFERYALHGMRILVEDAGQSIKPTPNVDCGDATQACLRRFSCEEFEGSHISKLCQIRTTGQLRIRLREQHGTKTLTNPGPITGFKASTQLSSCPDLTPPILENLNPKISSVRSLLKCGLWRCDRGMQDKKSLVSIRLPFDIHLESLLGPFFFPLMETPGVQSLILQLDRFVEISCLRKCSSQRFKHVRVPPFC
jgi:hypothetical protein